MDVGMSSIQAYKAHKQEGILVSKVHKQGALGTSSQASLHQWLHCMSIRLFTRGRFSESNAYSMRIGSVHILSDNLRTESHRIQCALSQSTSRES